MCFLGSSSGTFWLPHHSLDQGQFPSRPRRQKREAIRAHEKLPRTERPVPQSSATQAPSPGRRGTPYRRIYITSSLQPLEQYCPIETKCSTCLILHLLVTTLKKMFYKGEINSVIYFT